MEIIGRERELAALRAAIDLAPGTPTNLTLHGDPGIGKTVLLQAGIRYAQANGIRVIGGCGYESEASLAFAGLYQLFAPVMEYVDRVEAFHRTVLRRVLGLQDGSSPDRLAVCMASLAAVRAIAEDGPVLIAVEDAHWVDVPTREVMMFMLLRFGGMDVRAIFARRPLTAAERVTPGIGMLEVLPLAEPAAGELLDLLHPNLPDTVRGRILRDAAGNPLALAELPSAAGTRAAVGLEMLPSSAPLRTRLEVGYAGRVTSLPPETRTALLLTALDGDRLERLDEAPQASLLSPEDIATVERLGLITRDSTSAQLRFRHPLVRSAIVNTASPVEIRAAHATLADRYHHQPERRLWHLAAATVEPDEEVAAEIERTAKLISARGGAGLAVAAVQRAAALSPAPADTARRLQEAAELATASGQLDRAQSLLDEARQHTDDPRRSARTMTMRAELLLRRDGDLTAASRLLERALERCTNPADHARAVKMLMICAFYGADPHGWQRFVAPPVEPGDSADGPARAGRTDLRTDLDRTVAALGGLPSARGTLHARLATAFEALDVDASPGRVVELCQAAMAVDALREYQPHLRGLVKREAGSGAVTHAAAGHLFTAHDRFLAGDWEASEQAAEAGMDLAVRHGLELAANDLRCHLGWLAAGRGDVATAYEYSRTIEQWAAPRGSNLHLALSARNLTGAALSAGDYEAAYHHATKVYPPGALPPFAHVALWTVLDLVEAAVRTGRLDEARAHLAAADELGLAELSPRLRLHLAAARALVSGEDAPDWFQRALALPDIDRWPFDHARVRLAFGELHRRRNQPGAARPELRRAADLFARLGATAWSRRAEQELRATGIAVNGPSIRKTIDPSTIDLTAQQLEVAYLAASGLSNKEIGQRLFLSPRTVGAHLYRIFPKLGITSRSALRDALAALDGTG
ncbi:AAA family ATPase [Micromonospora sp. NPDC051296]|uniref:AAA family ATPase n=1 Tax=Micromonospora sp. NPDC051296 TaxID=3155046 RepID=UPI0034221943